MQEFNAPGSRRKHKTLTLKTDCSVPRGSWCLRTKATHLGRKRRAETSFRERPTGGGGQLFMRDLPGWLETRLAHNSLNEM